MKFKGRTFVSTVFSKSNFSTWDIKFCICSTPLQVGKTGTGVNSEHEELKNIFVHY